jgi:hypothetical protein
MEELLGDLRSHGVTADNKPYLLNLMLTGTTHPLRKQIWLELTGAAKQLRFNPNYYTLILSDANVHRSIFAEMIDRDICRTFPEEAYFQLGSGKAWLHNVLVAYSWRNPNVGYCQGMNFIAARFLSFGFREEEAFWILCAVVESLLPIDYFSVLSGILIDQRVFGALLNSTNSELKQHLETLGIDASMFCVKWLGCLFANTLSKEVVLRVWDVFLVQGSELLFRTGLALLQIMAEELLAAKTFEKVIHILSTRPGALTNSDLILELANNLMDSVTIRQINQYREALRPEALKFMESKSWAATPQTLSSDMCISDEDCKKRTQRSASFFVFHAETVGLREDYLYGEVQKYHFDEKGDGERLMRGRKSHKCWLEHHSFLSYRPRLNYYTETAPE